MNDAHAGDTTIRNELGDPGRIAQDRHSRALTQPAIVAISILSAGFSLVLVAGITRARDLARFPFFRDSPPAVPIVIGATGMFACLVLFSIGYVVNRLK